MTPSSHFDHVTLLTGNWQDSFAVTLIILFIILSFVFLRARPDDRTRHEPKLAWMRGGLYFLACFIMAWATGVFQTITTRPIVTTEQLTDPLWIAMTVLALGTICFGYLYWWPKGTVTHGRKLYPLPTLAFGILWGLSEGQLILSIYAIAETFGWSRWINAAVTYIVIGAVNGAYHALWWDIHVAPPHNIREWNAKKVLFAHTPNLLVTLTYFTMFGNAGLFVLLQTLSLASSTWVMRFPPYFAKGGSVVDRDTAVGIPLTDADKYR